MDKGVYLAICYFCNERCRFCPCSLKEKTERKIIAIEELEKIINCLAKKGCPSITLSGGEPTLHPDFVEVIANIQEKGMKVTVLTNGERLSEQSFIQSLVDRVDLRKLRIITTLHSHLAGEHEKANGTPGSFLRSISGLKKIHALGAKVEIKHCITIHNVKDLKEFYDFCDIEFYEDVSIQLCSIDYCGMDAEHLEKEMLPFPTLQKDLERIFDRHLERKVTGSQRRLYGINIPLCACDVYYWKFLSMKKRKVYDGYVDPYTEKIIEAEKNVMISPIYCKDCKVTDICIGTYKTAFEYFGSDMIKPYH